MARPPSKAVAQPVALSWSKLNSQMRLRFDLGQTVYLFRGPHSFFGRKDRHDLSEAARKILDRRYAGGEITKEQYEEMRRVLAS